MRLTNSTTRLRSDGCATSRMLAPTHVSWPCPLHAVSWKRSFSMIETEPSMACPCVLFHFAIGAEHAQTGPPKDEEKLISVSNELPTIILGVELDKPLSQRTDCALICWDQGTYSMVK